MVTVDEFSHVISEVYASSANPGNWAVALAEIGRILDATGCAVISGEGTGRSVASATVPVEALESYVTYYHSMDYVLDAVERGPAGLILGGQALVALRSRSEFDSDFMRPYGMDDGLFIRLPLDAPTTFLVAAAKRSEPFDTAERVKFMGALLPHLQQALRAQNHVAELGNRIRDVTAVIDAIRHGLLVVDAGSLVVQTNSAADDILTVGDGLCVRSGRVEAIQRSANERLQRSIAEACVRPEDGPRRGDSLVCGRPSGKRPYVIHILPLAASEGLSASRALVMIVDPEWETEPPKLLMRRLFGLTNAEADVALRVMRGDGLKPISADLALSVATVKTHLQHIFEKTGTHRQAELVRLLLTTNSVQR